MPSLVTPPTSGDSSNFSERGDSFHTALAVFNEAVNQEAASIQQVQLGNAYYGAVLPWYTATSVTSNTVGYGNLTFTVQTYELFQVGSFVRASSGVNWLSGVVTAYTPATGILVLKVLAFSGSGTLASWTFRPEFMRVAGALTTVASAATVDLSYATDKVLEITGTTQITAFTLVKGQTVWLIAKAAIAIAHNSATLQLPAALNYIAELEDILQLSEHNGVVSAAIYRKSGRPFSRTQKAIFAYGVSAGSTYHNIKNLISSSGTIALDATGAGTARSELAAATYGSSKAIFAYGFNSTNGILNMSNLVSDMGDLVTDGTAVGSVRSGTAAVGYGGDKAMFAYGNTTSNVKINTTNLVSNTGVIAGDTSGAGTARYGLAAASYGGDKAIFGYGESIGGLNISNLVSNTGVVVSDGTGVGAIKSFLPATSFGTDKAVFGWGGSARFINHVSNLGIVASDITNNLGIDESNRAGSGYGGDKGLFAYGYRGGSIANSHRISSTGILSGSYGNVGTARYGLAAAGYSLTP